MRSREIRVALVITVALIAAACTSNDANNTTVALSTTVGTAQPPVTTDPATVTTTTSTLAATTTTAEPSDELEAAFDDALAVKDSLFIAFNSGDAEGVMEVFAADASFSKYAISDREGFEEQLAWDIVQGTRYTPSDCAVSEAPDAGVVRVSCLFKIHDAAVLAVGAPPVPASMTLEITERGVVAYREAFGKPDFTDAGIPLVEWMETHHPDDVEAVFFVAGTWDSIEDATSKGTLRAQYAADWGSYLEDNGCGYRDNC